MGINQAIADFKRFSQAEWSVEISLTTPDKANTVVINGLATRHHMSYDASTGMPANVRNVHISVAESVLIDAGYTTRNANGEVSLRKHIATLTDANGTERTYKVDEVMPDDTIGCLVLILGDYNGS